MLAIIGGSLPRLGYNLENYCPWCTGGYKSRVRKPAQRHFYSWFTQAIWVFTSALSKERSLWTVVSLPRGVSRLTGEIWRGPLSCTSKDEWLCLTCPNRFCTFFHLWTQATQSVCTWTYTTTLTFPKTTMIFIFSSIFSVTLSLHLRFLLVKALAIYSKMHYTFYSYKY